MAEPDAEFEEALRNLVAPEHRVTMLTEVLHLLARSSAAKAARRAMIRERLLLTIAGDRCEKFMGPDHRPAVVGYCFVFGQRHAMADDGAEQACWPCILHSIFGELDG